MRAGWLAVGLSLMGVLTGCSKVTLPEEHQYQLQALATVKATGYASSKTLLVSKPEANEPYQGDDMLYINAPYQLKPFAKNRWVAPPADMLAPLMVTSLQNSHQFKAVVDDSYNGDVTYRLETRLLQLNQSFLKRPSEVSLVVMAYLIDDRSNRVLRSKRFVLKAKAPSDSPNGGVLAANQATRDFLNQLQRFIAR